MSPLRKGQRVECINGIFRAKERYWCKELPIQGSIYTIRDITPGFRGLGVRLVELVNPPIPVIGLTSEIEPLFLSTRFRPCESRTVAALKEAVAS